MKIKKSGTILLILAFIAGSGFFITGKQDGNTLTTFHSEAEKKYFQNQMLNLIDSGEYFLHSENCQGCHGNDTLGIANVDSHGEDINLFDDWSATMMANSARDPLWRAKVSHEILVDPGHATELQDKCTSCHAPMGNYTSLYHGNPHYSIAVLDTDSLGLDGVSCGACHMIGSNQLGSLFSGAIPYDTSRVEFGPFQNPEVGPMQLYVGIIPTYSLHMDESRACSPCHTLITNTADLNGTYTGGTFVEQATYQEWLNSVLPADNVTCQRCHMPQSEDSIIIANGILNLPPRAPFNEHKFMGANMFMLELIKNNKASLGINTEDRFFDSTLSATSQLLRLNTLDIRLLLDSITPDTAFITLRLTNKAGHKFPSGYPSRRAVVQFLVHDQNNDTIFSSGLFDPNYEVVGIDPVFEPHYNIITQENQAQIYEFVMGDVNANKTTVLERADTILKDNRLTPDGFLTTSPQYDTVPIVGEAFSDPDFNKNSSGVEGTGRDEIHYHVPVSGIWGTFTFNASIYYQSVPPGWLNEMFSYNSPAIDSFRNQYMAADRTPFLMVSDSINAFSVGVNATLPVGEMLRIYPNPVSIESGKLEISGLSNLKKVKIFDVHGAEVKFELLHSPNGIYELHLPSERGMYLLDLETEHRHFVKKIVVN